MQDTPQFDSLKQQFSKLAEPEILGTDKEQIADADNVGVIKQVFTTIPLYFNDKNFRQTLTLVSKQNIEGQIQNVINQLQQIADFRNQGNLMANLQSTISNIASYMEELRFRFVTPYKIYKAEGNSDIADSLKEIETTKADAVKYKQEIESILGASKDIANYKGATLQANYFYRIHCGKTIEEAEEADNTEKRKIKARKIYIPTREHLAILLALSTLAALYVDRFLEFVNNLTPKAVSSWLVFISINIAVGACYSLYRLADKFNKRYKGGYERASKLWAGIVVLSLVAVAAYSYVVISTLDLTSNGIKIEEAVIKAVLLLAPVYLIRFSVRNFNANKHLSAINEHRAASIRVSELFMRAMNEQNSAAYVEMVKLLFAQEETGYITRREGAGSGDANIQIPSMK